MCVCGGGGGGAHGGGGGGGWHMKALKKTMAKAICTCTKQLQAGWEPEKGHKNTLKHCKKGLKTMSTSLCMREQVLVALKKILKSGENS